MPKVALAAGHDNQAEMKRFKDIDGCLFELYFEFIEQEWHSYEDRELSGNRRYKVIGSPWTKWKFPVLTIDEWNYLFQTVLGGEQSAPVTIHTWDMDADEYTDYNATMHINQNDPKTYEYGERRDIEIEFYDLVEIV